MKTAIEIINEIDPLSVRHDIAYLRVLDCMKAYAKQVDEHALKDASENALPEYVNGNIVAVDKQSVLNTEIKLP